MTNQRICINLQLECPMLNTFEYYTFIYPYPVLSRRTLWRRGIRKLGTPNGRHPLKCFVKASLVSRTNQFPLVYSGLLYHLISSSFNHILNLTTCSLLVQKRWPPTCAMWEGWTSLRSLIMTTWGSSSLICSTGTAMSLTMNMTGSANHLWVPLTESTPSIILLVVLWNPLIGLTAAVVFIALTVIICHYIITDYFCKPCYVIYIFSFTFQRGLSLPFKLASFWHCVCFPVLPAAHTDRPYPQWHAPAAQQQRQSTTADQKPGEVVSIKTQQTPHPPPDLQSTNHLTDQPANQPILSFKFLCQATLVSNSNQLPGENGCGSVPPLLHSCSCLQSDWLAVTSSLLSAFVRQ